MSEEQAPCGGRSPAEETSANQRARFDFACPSPSPQPACRRLRPPSNPSRPAPRAAAPRRDAFPRRDARPGCRPRSRCPRRAREAGRAAAGRRPEPLLAVPHPVSRGLADVQEGRGVLLDRGGGGPGQGRARLGKQAQRRRALLHLHGPGLLRRLGRDRAREPDGAVLAGDPDPRGQVLLRLPGADRKHPQRDVLPAHRHLHQGPAGARLSLQRHRERSQHPQKGRVGAQVDLGPRLVLRAAPGRLCRHRGHLLLWRLRLHLLAQEARPHARSDLLQRAHLARRGAAHGLCLPAVFHGQGQARPEGHPRRHHRGRRHRAALLVRGHPVRADRHERRADEAVRRVRGGQAARRPGAGKVLLFREPVRLHGPHLASGQDQLLREARGRVPKVGHPHRQLGRLHDRGGILDPASRRGIPGYRNR